MVKIISFIHFRSKKYNNTSQQITNDYDSFSDSNDVIINLNYGKELLKANKPDLSKISPFFRRILKFTNELHFVDLDTKMMNLVYEYVQDKTGVEIPPQLKPKFCNVLRIFEIDDLEVQNASKSQVCIYIFYYLCRFGFRDRL